MKMFSVTKRTNTRQSGFALLMTLLVVSVVITAGLTILDVSIKQVRLSGNSKDSEIAFHATTAGLECAQFWRRFTDAAFINQMEVGADIDVECFGQSQLVGSDVSGLSPAAPADIDVELYTYEFSWGTAPDRRCSQMTTLVIMPQSGDIEYSRDDNDPADLYVGSVIPNFPTNVTKDCAVGSSCTVISIQGYNRACPATGTNFPAGTIQREVLLQF